LIDNIRSHLAILSFDEQESELNISKKTYHPTEKDNSPEQGKIEGFKTNKDK
jgi:hypothetical protein